LALRRYLEAMGGTVRTADTPPDGPAVFVLLNNSGLTPNGKLVPTPACHGFSPPDAKTGHFLSASLRTLVRTMAAFRSFQYLLQPTARQARALEHLLGVQPAPSKARSGGRRGMTAQVISSRA
jgi:hypothetical protein